MIKKNLDQYFLTNVEKIKSIIDNAVIKHDEIIFEAGAGVGSFAALYPATNKIILVDIDRDLTKILEKKFPLNNVITGDALSAIENQEFDILFSNLPYYLSDKVFKLLIRKNFRVAFIAVKKNFNYKIYNKNYFIETFIELENDDFSPNQPFKTEILKLSPLNKKYNLY